MKERIEKAQVSINFDREILIKLKKEAEKTGTSVSQLVNVACMAMVDKKALLRHTGGLFKKLSQVLGDEISEAIEKKVEVEVARK